MTISFAEYIWLDGTEPTQQLRSKTRIVEIKDHSNVEPSNFPEWGFDGSSTNQAAGNNSDCAIKPVNVVKDPIRGGNNYLVLCEVFTDQGQPHDTNTRYKLRKLLESGAASEDPLLGFEQEYTLYKDGRVLGFPERGYPGPQGPYYCGVGAERIFGRDLVEEHLKACADADLLIYGINAEVMPGQWEFQIGYRGFEKDDCSALNICDHMWLATWLLERLGENYGFTVSFSNKPMKGDWNGAGCHTNFSTNKMRNAETGKAAIQDAINRLEAKHQEHIEVYGDLLFERLTGAHETCSINEFKAGESDRGASIRIPLSVREKGYGYIEDRRPGANSDPYVVAEKLISTICDSGVNSTASQSESELIVA